MDKLRDATLLFLIKRSSGKVTDICLAMKKRGFGQGRWNGSGGKVHAEENETVEDAAKREAKEEINIEADELIKMAELAFYFPHNPLWNQLVHVYFVEKWQGEPAESEEMRPAWFSINKLPYQEMWADDIFWLSEVLEGKLLKAIFTFNENESIKDKIINIVQNF